MLAVGAAAAGCGDDGAGGRVLGAAAIAEPAVALRSELAAAFGERAWLTAFAARATLLDGVGSPAALGARRALDRGTAALASALGDARGAGTEAAALTLLRAQDGLWSEVAAARAAADAPAAAAARARLAANRRALARLLARDAPGRARVDRDLALATTSLAAAVEAVAAGRASAPAQTATAALRAARPAGVLADGAGARRGPPRPGRATSPAGELAASAAVAFTDLAYAQATASAAVATRTRDPERLRAAGQAVGATTDALGQLLASVYGEDAGERFAALWAARAGALTDYTRAKTGEDLGAAARALTRLQRLRTDTVTLLAEVDPDGSSRALADALRAHGDAATAAIRAQAAGSPKLGPRLLDAARTARAIGRALAVRAARQFPEKFPAD
jgi:hypothetical protein